MRQPHNTTRAALLGGCLALLTLVGCDSATPPTYTGYTGPLINSNPLQEEGRTAMVRWAEAHPLPSPTGGPLPVPVGTVAGERILPLVATWDTLTPTPLQHFAMPLGGGYQLRLSGLSRDGRLLLGVADPPYPSDGSPPDRSMILVFADVADRQLHSIATMPDPIVQPLSFQSDGTWLTWVQGAPERGLVDYQAYAYNRLNHARRLFARGADDKVNAPGLDYRVQLDHGQVVWTARGPNDSRVNLEDLATGKVTLLAEHGFDPQIAWPNVAWIDAQRQVIVVLNTQDGTRTTLAKPWHPVEFVLAGDTIAWTGERRDRITLTNLTETVVQPLTMGTTGASFNFYELQLNERFVSWTGPPELQMWDRRQNALVRPAAGEAGYFHVSPQHLMWADWDRTGTKPVAQINILDTSRLP